MLIDAHTHLTPQQARHKDLLPENMLLLVNTATAQEAQWLFGMREPRFVPTVGLHPWEAGRHGLEELAPFWERCAAIGEIGLDSVWCDVPAARQEEVFCRQLDLAQRLQKPVILHVKGCEQRAAHLLSCFSMPKLVHWYSSPDHLDEYLAMDCYFTVGPHLEDEAVRQVALRAPLSRLLLETDGLDAIAWATGRHISMKEYAGFLREQLKRVAALRGIAPHELERQMEHTLCTFLGSAPVIRRTFA